ncbi:glycosyltransferase [Candidatus Pelagibacter sp.]|jgi:glycosyltransferase involved in cell wall biosynthesis|nr:glycosyltransferase [Candidatus Pelagibacter sp.]
MKIAVLLPYKENFSVNYAGAVSLFVKDIVKNSEHFNSTYVYGNMTYPKPFLKKYINLPLKKKFFKSSSKIYIEEFLKKEKLINADIIEIHNRPNYIKYLRGLNKKIILYFHNDPLSMSGSKNAKDRLFLLNNIDKILFNSKWSQDRFFIKLKNEKLLKQKTSVCYQSTSRKKINFKNKQKIISFIGKLNSAKGYDLFGKAIIKILDEFPNWNARVIGDEPREKISFNHKQLVITGYTNHEKVLNFLEKVSISVVCSRWEEPFGRTSLEASSRGSAVIISNRGGLPETSSKSIILKNLSSENIYKELKKLIKNPNKLRKLQKQNYKSFTFDHGYISKLIDNVRSELLPIKNIFIKKNRILKIMHITNFNDRFDGRLHYNTGRRLNNGFIRNGHNVLSISDRDVTHSNKKINDLTGNSSLQLKIINTFKNFSPDLVVLGHADRVSNITLETLKDIKSELKISQWFLDPLSKFGPDHLNNKNRILAKSRLLDSTFLTTNPNSINFDIKDSFFIPNPCDKAFEILSNYKKNCNFDVFFAMSHGVHRGRLKSGKFDDREIFINKLISMNNNLSFDIYGMNKVQPIWGDQFISRISNSYMGINLSRGKPIKYYSSDRIAQLIGNGLLTFINKKTFLSDFFDNKEVIFYDHISDLSEKLNKYKKDTKSGKKIAHLGKKKYFKYFNSDIVSDYIISKTFDLKPKNHIIW